MYLANALNHDKKTKYSHILLYFPTQLMKKQEISQKKCAKKSFEEFFSECYKSLATSPSLSCREFHKLSNDVWHAQKKFS